MDHRSSIVCDRSVPVSAGDPQIMVPHRPTQTHARIEQIADAVATNHPFGKGARPAQLAPLARTNQANQPDFIGAETGAAGLVVTNAAPRVLLQSSHQRSEAGQGFVTLRTVQLSGELLDDHRQVAACIFAQSQGPSAQRPDEQEFCGIELQHRCRPRDA